MPVLFKAIANQSIYCLQGLGLSECSMCRRGRGQSLRISSTELCSCSLYGREDCPLWRHRVKSLLRETETKTHAPFEAFKFEFWTKQDSYSPKKWGKRLIFTKVNKTLNKQKCHPTPFSINAEDVEYSNSIAITKYTVYWAWKESPVSELTYHSR